MTPKATDTPIVRNSVIGTEPNCNPPFATGNTDKQKEIQRILGGYPCFIDGLEVDEIQSRDPFEVAKKKAMSAWRANNFMPIVVEDVSLTIPALEHLLPAPYVNDWAKTLEARKNICNLLTDDRRVMAQTIYAVFDGKQVHVRAGKTAGTIPAKPAGTNGFGWDDIFIPESDTKTFAQMTDTEKDSFSMRKRALSALKKEPFPIAKYVFQLTEPFADELARIRTQEVTHNSAALHFAYALEVLGAMKPRTDLCADTYNPIHHEDIKNNGAIYFSRYATNPDSPSLGLILTSISRARVELTNGTDGDPVMYQMGPQQRKIAIAQRVVFFKENQNKEIHKLIDELETGKRFIPARSNRRHAAVDLALEIDSTDSVSLGEDIIRQTVALEQIGYRKQSSVQLVSRRIGEVDYLMNKIGKHFRRIILGGSMPPATGGRDALVTAAIGHMAMFIPRNSVFAANLNRQIELAHAAHRVIDSLKIPLEWRKRAKQNIGASLGIDNPQKTVSEAQKLFEKAHIRLFRIYTIGADPRVTQTARLLRKSLGENIELFIGQIADRKQGLELVADDICADALIFGHGGGRQCTSAENGMGVTTLEEVYEVVRDARFNNTTVLLEGGVGRNIGAMLILGVDGILYNQRIMHGTIESPGGDIFFVRSGEFVQPYPGSASAETQLIESVNPALRTKRTNIAGRISTEGSSGFMKFERKSGGSMTFWIDSLLHDASRMLADLGVKNLGEMRNLIANPDAEFLRLVTTEARYKGTAYGNGK